MYSQWWEEYLHILLKKVPCEISFFFKNTLNHDLLASMFANLQSFSSLPLLASLCITAEHMVALRCKHNISLCSTGLRSVDRDLGTPDLHHLVTPGSPDSFFNEDKAQ